MLPVLAHSPSTSKIHVRQPVQQGEGCEQVVKKQLTSRKQIGLEKRV